MIINIESLLKKPGKEYHIEQVYDAGEYDLDIPRARRDSPLEVDIELYHAGNGIIRLRGRYKIALEIDCGRCLKPIEERRDKEVKGVFVPSDYGEEVDIEEGEYRTGYADNEVSLWDLIRQDIIVTIPMQPLCSEDCKGLCPVCGQDLNEKDCGHEPDTSDPRLAALKEIKIEEKED
ncbi:MAG: YceD family protein [bacterium]